MTDCTAEVFSLIVQIRMGGLNVGEVTSCCDRVSDFLLSAASYLKCRNGRKSSQIKR